MNQTKLTNAELDILKTCINQKLFSFTGNDGGVGGYLLTLTNGLVAVDNDYRLVPYFGGEEELPGFNVLQLKQAKDYHFLTPDYHKTWQINQKITGVQVIRDEICVKFSDGHSENYVVDEAIIFELEKQELLFALEISYSPITIVKLAKSVARFVPSDDDISYSWSDDDHQTYQATVNRHELDLSKEEF